MYSMGIFGTFSPMLKRFSPKEKNTFTIFLLGVVQLAIFCLVVVL